MLHICYVIGPSHSGGLQSGQSGLDQCNSGFEAENCCNI
jgi:hypothetical protein